MGVYRSAPGRMVTQGAQSARNLPRVTDTRIAGQIGKPTTSESVQITPQLPNSRGTSPSQLFAQHRRLQSQAPGLEPTRTASE